MPAHPPPPPPPRVQQVGARDNGVGQATGAAQFLTTTIMTAGTQLLLVTVLVSPGVFTLLLWPAGRLTQPTPSAPQVVGVTNRALPEAIVAAMGGQSYFPHTFGTVQLSDP